MPRVEGLAESLSAPAPEGEIKEEERRTALKRYNPNLPKVGSQSDVHYLLGNWITFSETSPHWCNEARSRGS